MTHMTTAAIKYPVASHGVLAGRLVLNAVKPNISRAHALGFGLRPDGTPSHSTKQSKNDCYVAGYQHQPTKLLHRKRRGIKPEKIKELF